MKRRQYEELFAVLNAAMNNVAANWARFSTENLHARFLACSRLWMPVDKLCARMDPVTIRWSIPDWDIVCGVGVDIVPSTRFDIFYRLCMIPLCLVKEDRYYLRALQVYWCDRWIHQPLEEAIEHREQDLVLVSEDIPNGPGGQVTRCKSRYWRLGHDWLIICEEHGKRKYARLWDVSRCPATVAAAELLVNSVIKERIRQCEQAQHAR